MMIPLTLARKIISDKANPLNKAESAGFLDSFGRVLAEDVKATGDLPPFSRATVDGFAIRSCDVSRASHVSGIALNVIGVVQAGGPSKKTVRNNEAVKIMTGGVLPNGADCVVMKEHARIEGKNVVIFKAVKKGDGISFRGESAQKGAVLLRKGARVTSGVVSLLATLGIRRVKVFRKPKVAILVTGNELLNVAQKLTPGKIRSSNQFGLYSQVLEAGCEPQILGIARDNLKDTRSKILKGLKADMLVISGGVSVGDFDLVPGVLKSLGVKIFIEKVAMQPGKPLIFGRRGKTYVFGLPGNPVSTMVCFYEFVRPCLLKMAGAADAALRKAEATLDEEIQLKPQRTKILRGCTFLRGGKLFVKLTSHQGSGNILSLAEANCLFEVAEGVKRVSKGTKVIIEYL